MPRGVIAGPDSKSQPFTRNLFADHMENLIEDEIPLVRNALFFYGFVRYETIFKQTFRIGFCFIFDRYFNHWILAGNDRYNYLEQEVK